MSQFPKMTLWNFSWCCGVSLVKFSDWSKFHVNIMTGSGFMTVFVYKGLTRNLEIESTPIWVLPNIWRPEQVKDTKLKRMSLIKHSWMLQNAWVTAFTDSKLLNESQQRWGKITWKELVLIFHIFWTLNNCKLIQKLLVHLYSVECFLQLRDQQICPVSTGISFMVWD